VPIFEEIASELGFLGGEGEHLLPRNATTLKYSASLVAKSGAGILYGFSGYNSGAAQFVQVFDSDTVPADTAVPVFVMTAAATANFWAAWVWPGRTFDRGIVICNSSTGPTKTIGSADCWFDVQFL